MEISIHRIVNVAFFDAVRARDNGELYTVQKYFFTDDEGNRMQVTAFGGGNRIPLFPCDEVGNIILPK